MTSRHKHAAPRRVGSGRLRRSATSRSSSLNASPADQPSVSAHSHRSAAARQSSARGFGVDLWRRRAVKVALPTVGVLAIVGASTAAVVSDPETAAVTQASATQSQAAQSEERANDVITRSLDETREVSRSAERPELPVEATSLNVTGELLALEDDVEIHADADGASPVISTVNQGETVAVTGETKDDWTQVVVEDLPRWVPTGQVGEELPLSNAPCPKLGESGLQPDTVKVLRAVCAEFPEVSEYGGIAGRGEHATGQALDVMVTGALGDQIAAFLQENRAELGIEYLIWKQRIWRPETSSAWRPMSSRGGATANHFDHVHVTTYGNSATG